MCLQGGAAKFTHLEIYASHHKILGILGWNFIMWFIKGPLVTQWKKLGIFHSDSSQSTKVGQILEINFFDIFSKK